MTFLFGQNGLGAYDSFNANVLTVIVLDILIFFLNVSHCSQIKGIQSCHMLKAFVTTLSKIRYGMCSILHGKDVLSVCTLPLYFSSSKRFDEVL